MIVIRTSLPASPSRQISMRFEALTRRTGRALDQRRRAPRTDTPASAATRDEQLMANWHEEVAKKREEFETFDNRFDGLVGVICAAAQEGITPAREDRYREQRGWFLKNYDTFKRDLGRHLESNTDDSVPGLWGRRSCDAFEAMFLPTNLKSLLSQDGGRMIGRMMRTQTAIAAYADAICHAEAALPETTA